MSRLRFLADEDFNRVVVAAVRRANPDVEITTIPERGLRGAPDEAVLELAATEGLAVLSHDTGTMTAEAWRRVEGGRPMPGLFLAAQKKLVRPVAESILLLWGGSDAAEWHGRVVFLPI